MLNWFNILHDRSFGVIDNDDPAVGEILFVENAVGANENLLYQQFVEGRGRVLEAKRNNAELIIASMMFLYVWHNAIGFILEQNCKLDLAKGWKVTLLKDEGRCEAEFRWHHFFFFLRLCS